MCHLFNTISYTRIFSWNFLDILFTLDLSTREKYLKFNIVIGV